MAESEFDPFPNRHAQHHVDREILRRLDALQIQLAELGGRIMAQIDDLKTALAGITSALDSVSTDVTALQGDAATLLTEVNALIALVQAGGTDLTDVLAQAQAIQSRVTTLNTDLATVDASLKAIPPVPGPAPAKP